MFIFYLIYLLVLYEAEKPASKVCGQPVPTARKYSVHTWHQIQSENFLNWTINVKCSSHSGEKLDDIGCLEHQ